jgi:FKBP-type peptidyl-prolyl cis-trans isomerase FklB
MKKFSMLLAVAAAAGMVSCTAQAPKADLQNEVDSLSYSMGLANTQGLRPYLENQLGVDSTYMADFIKGLNEAVKAGDDKKKSAYYAGIQIGQQISQRILRGLNFELAGKDSVEVINVKNFMAGFIAGAVNDKAGQLMTVEDAEAYAREHMETLKAKMLEEKYADNKEAGEKFLAANKKKEGVVTTPSGLQYKIITEGTGEVPADTSRVSVNYTGKLIDGTVFDSNADRKDKDGNVQPATFGVTQVIKGWTEALKLMPVGSKWEIYIPQELAYGSREAGKIKPFSALVFEVELVEIAK